MDDGKVIQMPAPESREQVKGRAEGIPGLSAGPIPLPSKPKVPKLAPLLKRVIAEMKTKAPEEIDAKKVDAELQGVRFGMRCMMILGGYKARQGLDASLTDAEIQTRADATLTLIMNIMMMLRAAEDVLYRHGIIDEYMKQTEHLQQALQDLRQFPQPSGEELARLQSMLGTMAKGADDVKGSDGAAPTGGVGLSDAGEAGQ